VTLAAATLVTAEDEAKLAGEASYAGLRSIFNGAEFRNKSEGEANGTLLVRPDGGRSISTAGVSCGESVLPPRNKRKGANLSAPEIDSSLASGQEAFVLQPRVIAEVYEQTQLAPSCAARCSFRFIGMFRGLEPAVRKPPPHVLPREQSVECFRICYGCFAGEIFADVSG
jgi:hypothetical protein